MDYIVDAEHKTTLVNLKLLGELGKNVKLNTHEKYFTLDYTTWDQGLRRFYRGDTRHATYEKVVDLIVKTKIFVELNSTDSSFREYIEPILKDAKNGLRSLQETYNSDKTFIAQISLEINIMDKILKGTAS